MIRNSQGKPLHRTAIKKKRSTPRRTTVYRNRGYLDWLAERMCPIREPPTRIHFCQPCDPAHGPSAAVRVKGPDNEAIALCRNHHIEQHQIGWPAFEAKYGFSRAEEAARLFALWQQENPTEAGARD